MAKVYALEGIVPVIHPDAFVHPTAVLIGDAVVGAGCYVGPCAVMRGDFGLVELKAGSNLQDHCMMHSFPDMACIVEENGHIGHGAILHGCTVKTWGMVGMNATIMDEAIVGEDAIVAANAFVGAKAQIPARTLFGGTPAKKLRDLTDDEVRWKRSGTEEYHKLTARCLASFEEVEPLSVRDQEGARLRYGTSHVPLAKDREQ